MSSTTPSLTNVSKAFLGTPFQELYFFRTEAFALTSLEEAFSAFIRAKTSERSSVSTVMP